VGLTTEEAMLVAMAELLDQRLKETTRPGPAAENLIQKISVSELLRVLKSKHLELPT
jgi:hypothetical protein